MVKYIKLSNMILHINYIHKISIIPDKYIIYFINKKMDNLNFPLFDGKLGNM